MNNVFGEKGVELCLWLVLIAWGTGAAWCSLIEATLFWLRMSPGFSRRAKEVTTGLGQGPVTSRRSRELQCFFYFLYLLTGL